MTAVEEGSIYVAALEVSPAGRDFGLRVEVTYLLAEIINISVVKQYHRKSVNKSKEVLPAEAEI